VGPPDESQDESAPRYARAGVDLDHDEGFVDEIREITRPTLRPEILSSVGGFAGIFKAPDRYENPVFVAGADGVGTKLTLAARMGRFDTVGIDCVAMVVNDLIVQGAEPLVFLDYVAMSRLEAAAAPAARCSGARPPPCPASTRRGRSSWWASASAWWSATG
jgi:phosphoribosylaminoimidazole (AIR) synthetase